MVLRWVSVIVVLVAVTPLIGCRGEAATVDEDVAVVMEAPFEAASEDPFEPDVATAAATLTLGGPAIERTLEAGDTDWVTATGPIAAGDLIRFAWAVESGSASVKIDYVLETGEEVSLTGGEESTGSLDMVASIDCSVCTSGDGAQTLMRLANTGSGVVVYRAVLPPRVAGIVAAGTPEHRGLSPRIGRLGAKRRVGLTLSVTGSGTSVIDAVSG